MNSKLQLCAFLLVVVVSGLALSGVLNSSSVQGATDVNGSILFDTTWTKAKSPYTLVGPVIVKSGVTLTIEAGVTVNLGSNYILVDGTLVAKGGSTDRIHFNSDEYAGSYPYYGVYFSESSIDWNEQTLTGSLIENAVFNLTAIVADYAAPKINSNAFSGNMTLNDEWLELTDFRGFTSISVIGDWPVISNNTLINAGIVIREGATPMVVNNTIIDTVPAIVNDTENHRVFTPSYVGISCSSSALISNNVISGWTLCGIDIINGYNSFEGPNYPVIENNLIDNNNIGIQLTSSADRSGFSLTYSTIQNNTITQNSFGLKIFTWSGLDEWSENLSMLKIVNNNIQDNFDYNLYARGVKSDVNATYNWWGTTDQDAINNTIYDDKNDTGQVNFIPFLTLPNPEAMPIPAAITTPPSTTPSPSQPSATPSSSPVGPQTGSGVEITMLIALSIAIALLVLLIAIVLRKKGVFSRKIRD